VLSDLGGIDVRQYLKDVLLTVRKNWYSLMPDEAQVPLNKKACVAIEFSIQKDGRTKGLKIVESSGDVMMERAAWGGITASSPLLPLPKEYTGQFLKLRFHFYYNPSPAAKPALEPHGGRSGPGRMAQASVPMYCPGTHLMPAL
jgi:TonB family protein